MRNATQYLVISVLATGIACSDSPGPQPRVATSLAFQTQPTASVKDTAVPGPVSVAILDQDGDVLTASTLSITIALGANPSGASLGGTATTNAVAGVATFSTLTLNAVGAGYTLVASSAGLTNATSSAFNVTLSLADVDADTFSPNQGDCNDLVASINPGEDDFPDPSFIDSDCDGIDGEEDNAVFVSPAGVNAVACGTRVSPCQTAPYSVTVAATAGKRDVYLTTGTFAGAISLANGVSLYGGYDASWVRGGPGTTTLTGTALANVGGTSQHAVTIYGVNLVTPTTVADVTIIGPNAIGQLATGQGRSSHAVIVRDVGALVLRFDRVRIISGNGASGGNGAAGTDAPTVDAQPFMNGFQGGDGREYNTACDATGRGGGGGAGTNSVPGGQPNGGAGGAGGEMDTNCNPFSLNLDSQAGVAGSHAAISLVGVYGRGGAFGPAGLLSCLTPPGDGLPGRIINGAAGAPATANGRLIDGFWYANDGTAGGIGEHGTGGGGGGGAGGCDIGTDSYGAGGGGGGAGGHRAEGAATGGKGGGGSFGVFLINASVAITQSVIERGNGGNGGNGGVGGRGQSGGVGNLGGLGPGGFPGGRGGNGAHGGHGAGGGGGAGGISAGIFLTGASSASTPGITYLGGAIGSGGQGGESAPNAPAAERDGDRGPNGANGSLNTTRTCLTAAAC